MADGPRITLDAQLALPGDIAIVHCGETLTFHEGNRLRAASCLVCGQVIGGQAAAIIGVAALAGEACECSGIVSDVFLVHASHLPMGAGDFQTAIRRGLECPYQII